MAEVLQVSVREEVGSNAVKRVRAAGQIPAILYGHQQANVNLAVPAEQVRAAIRHGSRMIELQGGVSDTALIREVQWDHLGANILHLDLTRVSATEKVQVSVRVELKGEAPGAKEGGMVDHMIHELEIECPASDLPEKLVVNINALRVGDSIKVSDLVLPPGVSVLAEPEEMVVHCVTVTPTAEEEAEAAESGEPEVIGRKPEEEEES